MKEGTAGSAKGKIALVDDEENLRETVLFALRREGYEVIGHPDGQQAWDARGQDGADVYVLDIMMPRMDGLELCRRLRAASESLPILFLTSRDEELDRVLGLELGADDYLCKPFSMRELIARVRVLFRRLAAAQNPAPATSPASQGMKVGALRLDLHAYEAYWHERKVPLTVTEFMILQALARHPGHVKTRQQLLDDGYPDEAYISDRTIDSHIKRLRRKLIECGPDFDEIETVYGLGYRYRQR